MTKTKAEVLRPKLIYVCSPYGGSTENIKIAKWYMKIVIEQGHIPIASHVLLHGVLNDHEEKEREAGIKIGLNLIEICEEVWIFGNKSWTPGMQEEIDYARNIKIPVKTIELVYSKKKKRSSK